MGALPDPSADILAQLENIAKSKEASTNSTEPSKDPSGPMLVPSGGPVAYQGGDIGKSEVEFLVARSVKAAAAQVAKDVVESSERLAVSRLFVYPLKRYPSGLNRALYNNQRLALVREVQNLGSSTGIVLTDDATPTTKKATPSSPTVLLDIVQRLLNFAKADYSTGTISVQYEDSLLLSCVCQSVLELKPSKIKVYQPEIRSTHLPEAIKQIEAEVSELTNGLALARGKEIDLQMDLQKEKNKYSVLPGADIDAVKACDSRIENISCELEKISKFVLRCSNFLLWLFKEERLSADSVFRKVVREACVECEMPSNSASCATLLVNLECGGGSWFRESNILTALGLRMPYKAAGGAALSFTLLSPEFETISCGVYPVYSSLCGFDDLGYSALR